MSVTLSQSRLKPKGVICALTIVISQNEILISLESELYLLSPK